MRIPPWRFGFDPPSGGPRAKRTWVLRHQTPSEAARRAQRAMSAAHEFHVLISGLKGKPHLNGTTGALKGAQHNSATGVWRYRVSLPGDAEDLAIKRDNLELVPGSKDPGVEIRDGAIQGAGVFATRPFQKGELVFVCRRDEALIDSWGSPTGRAGMEEHLKKLRRMFPQFAVNHSCGPNVFSLEQSIQRNQGSDGSYFFALRSISKGEEITKAYKGALHLGRAARAAALRQQEGGQWTSRGCLCPCCKARHNDDAEREDTHARVMRLLTRACSVRKALQKTPVRACTFPREHQSNLAALWTDYAKVAWDSPVGVATGFSYARELPMALAECAMRTASESFPSFPHNEHAHSIKAAVDAADGALSGEDHGRLWRQYVISVALLQVVALGFVPGMYPSDDGQRQFQVTNVEERIQLLMHALEEEGKGAKIPAGEGKGAKITATLNRGSGETEIIDNLARAMSNMGAGAAEEAGPRMGGFEDWEETRKVLKAAYKQGVRPPVMSFTAGTPPEGFKLLQDAQMAFMSLGAGGAFKGERAYHAYYDDLQRDRANWLAFLAEAGNNVYAERSCGILGTLATIYRQRSEIAAAEGVLEMEGLILPLYKRHAFEVGGTQGLVCHAGLEYKYNVIRYNLYRQTGRMDLAVPVFRDLAAHEIRSNYSFEEQSCAHLIPIFLDKEPTMAVLDSLSSNQILKIFREVERLSQSCNPHADVSKAQRKACGGCAKEEEFRGDFNLCARCKKVAYCSRDCQKAHWKTHKPQCSPK